MKSLNMKTLNTVLLAGAMTGPAMAGLVIVDGLAPEAIPSNNDFQAQLGSLGFDMVYDDGSDILATTGGTVLFYYHGAESQFVNQFVINGVINGAQMTPGTVLQTEADEAFTLPGTFIGSIDIAAGQKFSDLGIGFNVLTGNKQQQDGPAGTDGFGAFYSSQLGGNNTMYQTVFFGFDDNGFRDDDNHDDMIISAVLVPEPGSIALLALGGACLLRRRR